MPCFIKSFDDRDVLLTRNVSIRGSLQHVYTTCSLEQTQHEIADFSETPLCQITPCAVKNIISLPLEESATLAQDRSLFRPRVFVLLDECLSDFRIALSDTH